MSVTSPPLLLIGSSVRAAAASAVRAGFEVFAIDRFGDVDLQRLATVVPIENWPDDVADAVRRLPKMLWMYCGPIENEPELVAQVSQHHDLLGNPPDVLKLIRDPFWVEATLSAGDLPTLRHRPAVESPLDGEWLIKPIRSGGGQGIIVWDGHRQTTDDLVYLQEFRRGRSVSALLIAANGDVTLIGLTGQLIGREYGAPCEFGYAGSLGPIEVPDQTRSMVKRIGQSLSSAAGLRGLLGIDFILSDNVPWVVEVNPRCTASAEIYERASGRSLVGEHVLACSPGSFPSAVQLGERQAKTYQASRGAPGLVADCPGAPRLAWRVSTELPFALVSEQSTRLFGKRIVYAETDIIVPSRQVDSVNFADFIADIPWPGSRIATGWPICTVFATGHDVDQVQQRLSERAREVHRYFASGKSLAAPTPESVNE